MKATDLADRIERSARNRDGFPEPKGRHHEAGVEGEDKVRVEITDEISVLCYVGYYNGEPNWDVYYRGRLAAQSFKESGAAIRHIETL